MEKIYKAKTYSVSIWIAGSVEDAKRLCKQYCATIGLCVTVTATDFIYTGGAEEGVLVRLVNYPRPIAATGYPKGEGNFVDIENTALDLAKLLRRGLFQNSVLIETPENMYWLTIRENL